MHKFVLIIALMLTIFSLKNNIAQHIPKGELQLESAINIAIENNADLKILRSNIKANKAIKKQNELLINPELDISAENLFGSNNLRGLSGSEITTSLNQRIILSDKKVNQIENARLDVSLAEWDLLSKQNEMIAKIKHFFNKAYTTQALVEMNNQLINISNELIDNLEKRVEAGKISRVEVSRAKIILTSLKIEASKLYAEYKSILFEISTLLNSPKIKVTKLVGNLKTVNKIPNYDSLVSKIDNNPLLKRFTNELEKRKILIELEKSTAIPDLTLSAGFKRNNEINSNSILVGASLPLPIFNRNQGMIQKAQIRLFQKESEYNNIKNSLVLKFNLNYNQLNTAINNINIINTEAIPDATKSFQTIKKGNLAGKYTMLDVLDAQKTLFELQRQYLDAKSEINRIIVNIEEVISTHIN